MRIVFDSVKNESVPIYDSVYHFLKRNKDMIFQSPDVYVIRSNDYPGCSGCSDCEQLSRLAKENDMDVIVDKKMHDIVALVDKE